MEEGRDRREEKVEDRVACRGSNVGIQGGGSHGGNMPDVIFTANKA